MVVDKKAVVWCVAVVVKMSATGGGGGGGGQEEDKKPMDQAAHINLKVKGQVRVLITVLLWVTKL